MRVRFATQEDLMARVSKLTRELLSPSMETPPTPDSDAHLESPTVTSGPGRWERMSERMRAPVSAFSVDLFRIATGLLVLVYFVRLLREYNDYTSEYGFLDHALHRTIFWFSSVTLFYPGSPDWYKVGLLLLGLLGSVMLTVGWHPKTGAALAWIIGVSVHRWNFAVINVDDSSITLLLWWILFLPVGHCLTYRTRDWRSEVSLRVDGFFVRAFFANLFIYYLTAGLTKLWSPLWREGTARSRLFSLAPMGRGPG